VVQLSKQGQAVQPKSLKRTAGAVSSDGGLWSFSLRGAAVACMGRSLSDQTLASLSKTEDLSMASVNFGFDVTKQDDFERYAYTRTRLMEECNYRRNRQWAVFSWATALMLAILGGVVTLYSTSHPIYVGHASALVVFIWAFVGASARWISHDAAVALYYSQASWSLDEVFGLKFDDRMHKKRHLAHIGLLIFLAATTSVAAFLATQSYADYVKQAVPASSKAISSGGH
jgi:hypothetical protein